MSNFKKRIIIFALLILVSLSLTVYFYFRSNKEIITIVSNEETSDIDYKVYLKPNKFFETPYLKKGQTYISTLIDYIDLTYDYTDTYTTDIEGKYVYYFKAIAKAKKQNDEKGYYFKKEYQLTKKKTVDIPKKNSFGVHDNIKINYQKYNELLTDFKNSYGLVINGELEVQLIIQPNFDVSVVNKNVKDEKVLTLTIPLTQQSVDISFDSNTNKLNNKNEFVKTEKDTSKKHFICKMCMLAFADITLIGLILILYFIIDRNNSTTFYTKELERILSTYDGIIVNIEKCPNLKEYNIIQVSSFDELIDAHSEVRLPINYVEVKKNSKSIFILIKNDLAWVYILSND